MKRLLLIFSLLCSFCFAATTEPTDLGNNLSYLRVHSLADSAPSLRAALSANRAFVLDLRYTTTDEESLPVLRAALARPPREAPLFILISPSTPATVVEAINQTPGAFISLGITGTRSARIEVKTDAGTDRRAYDALDAGTPLDTLISGKIEKERFDEATLVQEFKNGNHDAEPPALPDPTSPKTANTQEPSAPVVPARHSLHGDGSTAEPSQVERLTDRVLQRAVHLHQALLALKSRG